jgi:hypothetical protein
MPPWVLSFGTRNERIANHGYALQINYRRVSAKLKDFIRILCHDAFSASKHGRRLIPDAINRHD